MPQIPTIYCDEAGFTGNNLLDGEQPVFAYAGVDISPQDAGHLVSKVIRNHKLQGEELKGKQLIKRPRGRDAIREVIATVGKRSKIFVAEKRYAMACKFFEYVFEPCISGNNVLFYEINFQRFIATLIYVFKQAADRPATEFLLEFKSLMEAGREADLNRLLCPPDAPNDGDVMSQIAEFAWRNRDAILDEAHDLATDAIGRWTLDLSSCALESLCREWGQVHDSFHVVCDESNALDHSRMIFDARVGMAEKTTIRLQGKEHPISYNLASPVTFASSKTTPGIQIADVVAKAGLAIAGGDERVDSMEWAQHLDSAHSEYSIAPEVKHMDLKRPEVQLNALVLCELVQRSRDGRDLLQGMPEFVIRSMQSLRTHPPC
jgi:hypothetical protein